MRGWNFQGLPDLYVVMGISDPAKADQQTIRSAFRSAAKLCHPDLNRNDPNAEEKFKLLNMAHEILSNPEARAAYDRERLNRRADSRQQPAGSGSYSQSTRHENTSRTNSGYEAYGTRSDSSKPENLTSLVMKLGSYNTSSSDRMHIARKVIEVISRQPDLVVGQITDIINAVRSHGDHAGVGALLDKVLVVASRSINGDHLNKLVDKLSTYSIASSDRTALSGNIVKILTKRPDLFSVATPGIIRAVTYHGDHVGIAGLLDMVLAVAPQSISTEHLHKLVEPLSSYSTAWSGLTTLSKNLSKILIKRPELIAASAAGIIGAVRSHSDHAGIIGLLDNVLAVAPQSIRAENLSSIIEKLSSYSTASSDRKVLSENLKKILIKRPDLIAAVTPGIMNAVRTHGDNEGIRALNRLVMDAQAPNAARNHPGRAPGF